MNDLMGNIHIYDADGERFKMNHGFEVSIKLRSEPDKKI